jgi:hypothetical protein
MADVQHRDITDPNIHEPKGVKFAPEGTAYVADGLGGGQWVPVIVPGGLTGASGAFYSPSRNLGSTIIASGSIFPFTSWPISLNWGDLKVSPSGGFLSVQQAGVYAIKARLNGSHTGPTPFGRSSSVTLGITKTSTSYTSLHTAFFSNITTIAPRNETITFDSGWRDAIVRLEPLQGIGVWATGKDEFIEGLGGEPGISRVTRTSLTLQMQIVRLSDG